MRRSGVRLLMVAVGVMVFVLYAAAAVAAFLVLRWLWLGRPALSTTVLIVVGLTLLFGYLTYQFGTARLLAGIDAAELPRNRAREFYGRIERASEPRGHLAHLYVHGDEEGPLTDWLETHPSMDDRIDRLTWRP